MNKLKKIAFLKVQNDYTSKIIEETFGTLFFYYTVGFPPPPCRVGEEEKESIK